MKEKQIYLVIKVFVYSLGLVGKAGNTLCYFVLNPIVFRCFKSPIDIQLYIYLF